LQILQPEQTLQQYSQLLHVSHVQVFVDEQLEQLQVENSTFAFLLFNLKATQQLFLSNIFSKILNFTSITHNKSLL
jgi:hypothetical protein